MAVTVGVDIKSVNDVPERSRRPLHDLILSLADSKRILGIRYSDWVLGAPELEANIAASSIAQDEWGHSRMLYALLKDFGSDPGAIEHERPASEYRNLEALDAPLATWPEFVVANAIIDTALTIQVEALVESRYAQLRQRVLKQLEEERFHYAHGAAWVRRLVGASDQARAALQDALQARWPGVVGWFGPDDYGVELKDDGLCDGVGAELRARFVDRVTPLIERAGAEVPATELDFANWNPATRRSSTTGPDEDAVARARGDKNRAFLMD